MDRFDRNDRRFILTCLAVIAAGALITIPLFYRAFPEASIQFKVNRSEARRQAETLLAGRGRKIADAHFAGRFDIEDDAKVYLERELGLEKAGAFYGRDAKVWRWSMRWYRSAIWPPSSRSSATRRPAPLWRRARPGRSPAGFSNPADWPAR